MIIDMSFFQHLFGGSLPLINSLALLTIFDMWCSHY